MTRSLITPRALRPGDRVAAISLSSGWPSVYPRAYEDGKRQLQEAFGVEVVESRYARADKAWLREHPDARAADLMETLSDPSISALISTIGGDDSIRMLPFLDLSVIREHPKIFLGYSDSTITHFAFLKAGVTSFYGPSIMGGFDENGGLFDYTRKSLRQMLFEPAESTVIAPNTGGWTCASFEWGDPARNESPRALQPTSGWKWLQGAGRRRGRLVGGCLEAVDWLRGTSVWPDRSVWKDSVLFLETSEDEPSPAAVTYMLRALGAVGALDDCTAVLLGRPFGSDDERRFEAYDRALLGVLGELGLTSLPVVTRMDFGHTDPSFVVPIGIEAEIDCDRQQLRLVQPPTLI
jgi:muramoyltetrapeptide carboxypeptidase LdcA involved in peptidoglycan recycling